MTIAKLRSIQYVSHRAANNQQGDLAWNPSGPLGVHPKGLPRPSQGAVSGMNCRRGRHTVSRQQGNPAWNPSGPLGVNPKELQGKVLLARQRTEPLQPAVPRISQRAAFSRSCRGSNDRTPEPRLEASTLLKEWSMRRLGLPLRANLQARHPSDPPPKVLAKDMPVAVQLHRRQRARVEMIWKGL